MMSLCIFFTLEEHLFFKKTDWNCSVQNDDDFIDWLIDWLIEQFNYVTFWHSKVKTDTFKKYHIQVDI